QLIIPKHNRPPSIPELGTQRLVELDGTLIPVQHLPAQCVAVLACSDASNRRQQGLAELPSSIGFADKQVFQEHLASSPGAVEIKEERVPCRLFVPICKQHAELGLRAKPVSRQIRFRS